MRSGDGIQDQKKQKVKTGKKLSNKLKIRIDMDDRYDILDVLFVVEALTVGYFVYLLWGTV